MKIEVLGTSCAKCKKLHENVEAALKQSGIQAEVEKVSSVPEIVKRGVMFTPALAIDGEIKSSGKVLAPDKIVELLQAAQA
ncbi:MAG: thioredoxin family protein [Armatimonadia bacterium]